MPKRARRFNVGELLMALGMLALGIAMLAQIRLLPEARGYEQLGPRLFPYVVGLGLALFGVMLGAQALTGGWRVMPTAERDPVDWRAFGLIAAALILQMTIIGTVGFVAASTLLFVLTARAFSSRAWVRNAAIGAIVSTAAFYLFTVGLGLHLAASPLGFI